LACAAVLIVPSIGQADADVLLAPIRAISKSVEDCISTSEFDVEAASCAGLSYDICIGFITGAVSHAQRGECYWNELGIWRGIYQKEVMKKLQWAREMDDDSALGLQPDMNAFSQVMETESSWVAYSNSQCKMELLPSTGGTRGITDVPLCHIRLLAQRIQQLRSLDDMEPRE